MAADTLEQLNAALAGRYAIERELGRGATAIVYLARDLRHGRQVALKVLNPELVLAVRSERFLREIQIAAQLNHPHILPLHDSGDASGTLFYVMPYVAGESLRDRLNREKQLPVEDALRIARDVAAALTAAHAAGVVHRDIKPENILLDQTGEAVVADFGIARALTIAVGQGMTEAGIAVGTPAYMSPEQATGGEVDGRCDVYSLGCVTYEMLAGRPPFTGTTSREVLARHALDPVPSLRSARPDVPRGVEETVLQALAKVPAGRHATPKLFVGALSSVETRATGRGVPRSWTYAAGMALVLSIGGYVALRSSVVSPREGASLGVLPCVPLSMGDDQYFSQGMAQELISELQRIPQLRVPAFSSSLAVAGKNLPIRAVAESLGAGYVLECTVRRAAGRLRLNVTLVEAAEGAVLWTETYDQAFSGTADLIAIQEHVARAVVGILPAKLSLPQSAHATTDSTTHDLYLLGQHAHRTHSAEGIRNALRFLEQATRSDTTFEPAFSELAATNITAGASNYIAKNEAYAGARAAAARAIALDSTSAEAHFAMGQVYYWADWNWPAAARELERAVALNPSLSEAHVVRGQILGILGRCDEAVEESQLARRLDPLTPNVTIGSTFLFCRRFDEAIREYQRVVDVAPEYPVAYGNLGRAYINAGRLAEAIPPTEKARSLRGRRDRPSFRLGYIYGRSGRTADAQKILAELLILSKSEPVWSDLAWVYLGLGDRARAVDAFISAVESRSVNPGFVVEPIWDSLRSDSRVIRLRSELGLPP